MSSALTISFYFIFTLPPSAVVSWVANEYGWNTCTSVYVRVLPELCRSHTHYITSYSNFFFFSLSSFCFVCFRLFRRVKMYTLTWGMRLCVWCLHFVYYCKNAVIGFHLLNFFYFSLHPFVDVAAQRLLLLTIFFLVSSSSSRSTYCWCIQLQLRWHGRLPNKIKWQKVLDSTQQIQKSHFCSFNKCDPPTQSRPKINFHLNLRYSFAEIE